MMTWGIPVIVFAKLLITLLSWPSFTLAYPLCASIWAVESDSFSRYHQCLKYWVLFSFVALSEWSFPKLFEWLHFWPYVKGAFVFSLVIPHFGGSSYIYNHLLRPYLIENSEISKILILPRKKNTVFNGQDNLFEATYTNGTPSEADVLAKHIFKGTPSLNDDTIESHNFCPTHSRKVQKEWSCALCLVSTSSEKCLKMHLNGKRHQLKEAELFADELAVNIVHSSSFNSTRTNKKMLLLQNINLEKSKELLNPVKSSIITCRWEKPDLGWTKLNTDGSIDREAAGFGGLFRDSKGNAICAFISKAISINIFLVELWAIWRGLVLALSLGITVLWVESDSMSVVKTINREQAYNNIKADSCLKHIWELLKKFDKYRVSHSWRETNRAADHLAKTILPGTDVVLWPADFPNRLCNIIKEDAQGKVYRRALHRNVKSLHYAVDQRQEVGHGLTPWIGHLG